MRALDRKLLRDLWQIKGQALAIALVIACGGMMLIMYFSAFQSLDLTLRTYYERYRFADVFAGVKRAPASLAQSIAEIPGVARVEARVVVDVTLDVPGMTEPAVGRLVSIPAPRRPILNDLFLRRGRWVEVGRPDEVLVSELFAEAHALEPGDRVGAVINGRWRQLTVVGVALSPEFIYSIQPGALMPDNERFGVFWMGREGLAAAFDMEGGFNDVALTLAPGATEAEVIDRLDQLLERYGGLGAIPRALQISHWFLDNELTEIKTIGSIMPVIFLAVAAFLLNVVLSRIVAVQREQIAALKALGYATRALAAHYLKLSLAIAVLGSIIAVFAGAWLGQGLMRLYNNFFRFPILDFRLDPALVVIALAVSLAAAAMGAASAVRRAVKLPPAEAMRPEPPAAYSKSLLERIGLSGFLSEPARMILRYLGKRPLRTALSILGIAFAGAMFIVGSFFMDALDEIMEVQFQVGQRQDVMISFVEPTAPRALYEARHLPGVMQVEPFRSVPVRLVAGHRERQTSLMGLEAGSRLNRVVDIEGAVVRLPPEGLALTDKLAEILGVAAGDEVTVEVLEGERPVVRLPVSRLVDEPMGTSAYMTIDALRAMMGEGRVLSGAFLMADEAAIGELHRQLKATPGVASVLLKQAAIDSFEETLAETMGLIIFFNVLFAGIITFGVVYNSARIALSERQRDLASLRVLGFTRAEISFILLGELAVITAAAVPLGLLLGRGLAALTTLGFDNELYRIPLIIAPDTYASAALLVVISAAVSGLMVRRRLDHLDLIGVLKTRE